MRIKNYADLLVTAGGRLVCARCTAKSQRFCGESACPVVITVDEVAHPPESTVITASASDQISLSSPDLKHGIFSCSLLKGLYGKADENRDGTITVGRLQSYLAERVPRFAMTMSR